ncbi:LPXTG cell wall anchor domain-containing protein [Mammaliicoccus stepanovicii]|nr:LPXTG cell wall anchor domain-containing protein [Mammaliicoccus stepanovicii]GGI43469.1 hypothetical protein GCM10010896_23570 [Mammaliicoccus stepanovicii]
MGLRINSEIQNVTDSELSKSVSNTQGSLPDTGEAKERTGLFGAVLSMLVGLGLIKKTRKDKGKKNGKDKRV